MPKGKRNISIRKIFQKEKLGQFLAPIARVYIRRYPSSNRRKYTLKKNILF